LKKNDLIVIFISTDKLKLYFAFLYYTGLRAGDIAMLKYSNFDQDKKAIVSSDSGWG